MTQEKQNDAILKMVDDMEVVETFLSPKGRFVGDMVHISIKDLAKVFRTELERAQRIRGLLNEARCSLLDWENVSLLADIEQALSAVGEPTTIKPPYVVGDDGEIKQVKPQSSDVDEIWFNSDGEFGMYCGWLIKTGDVNYPLDRNKIYKISKTPAENVQPTNSEPQYGEWLPIESAPKDGAPYLAWVKGREMAYTWWDEVTSCLGHKKMGFKTLNGYWANFGCCENPTHWMPLPNPPTGESQKG